MALGWVGMAPCNAVDSFGVVKAATVPDEVAQGLAELPFSQELVATELVELTNRLQHVLAGYWRRHTTWFLASHFSPSRIARPAERPLERTPQAPESRAVRTSSP